MEDASVTPDFTIRYLNGTKPPVDMMEVQIKDNPDEIVFVVEVKKPDDEKSRSALTYLD